MVDWLEQGPVDRGSRAIQLHPFPGVDVEAQLLCFPAPHSATGEDVAEVHLPGSPALVEAVQAQLLEGGTRLAEPGEFTRRAFLHGRLDLTQAEAVLELVESRSAAAARAASEVLSGSLGEVLERARQTLTAALAELEAGLDFEEGDSQDVRPSEIQAHLVDARAALEQGLQRERARQLRRGSHFRIGLFGPANAGKTTLFARLTGESSLISKEAGTTRDRREADWRQPGEERPWRLVDLPGIGGVAADPRDAAARQLVEGEDLEIDLVWLCLDPQASPELWPTRLPHAPWVLLWTRAQSDPPKQEAHRRRLVRRFGEPLAQLTVDSREGDPASLQQATEDAFRQAETSLAQHLAHSRRHQEALAQALERLEGAEHWSREGGQQDLVAEELRSALHAVALLVGHLDHEVLLDQLFAKFCIGK